MAVRKGSLVLVPSRVGANGGEAGKPQLFDLTADLSQRTNLAAKRPDAGNELTLLLERLKRAGGTRPGWSPR